MSPQELSSADLAELRARVLLEVDRVARVAGMSMVRGEASKLAAELLRRGGAEVDVMLCRSLGWHDVERVEDGSAFAGIAADLIGRLQGHVQRGVSVRDCLEG